MGRSWFIGVLVGAIFGSVALAEKPAPAEESGEPPPGQAQDEARRAKVFARVGAETITVGDLEDIINTRSPFIRKRYTEPEALKQFADDQVKLLVFQSGAERNGYGEDPEIRRFVNETIVQLYARDEFDDKIRLEAITDEEIKAFYNENADQFRRPEMRRASHILVDDKAKAQALIKELRGADTKTFRAAAKENSLDTETKLRGGDLLFFAEDGRMPGGRDTSVDETLVQAAFSIEETGELGKKPVALGEGKWSVVMLTGVRPAKVQSLKDAKEGIRRRIWREKRKAAMTSTLDRLQQELEPEVFPERMAPITLAEPPTPPTPAGH